MNNKHKKHFYRKPLTVGLLVFGVFFIITQLLSFQKYRLNVTEEKQNTIIELNRVTDQLKVTLNNSLAVTKTLALIVENYGIPENFSEIAAELLDNYPNIDAVQILENGIITHVYPLEGNEVIIGYNVLEDQERNKDLIAAYENKELHFSGPFQLRQEGVGVIGRYPVNGQTKYNFTAVIITLGNLLHQAGINEKEGAGNFEFQLSKINPSTNQEEFFIKKRDQEFLDHSVLINLPNQEWRLYAGIKESNRWDGILLLSLLGLFLSILGGYLFWFLSQQPEKLQQKVKEKTQLVIANEQRFKALVENSLDGVAILNREGTPTYISPSIFNILGYTVEEMLQINLFDILHEDEKLPVVEELETLINNPGLSIKGYVSRLKHKDGSWRWMESAITNLLHVPAINGLVDNFRDITHKKLAEDQLIREKMLSEAVINSLPGIVFLYNKKGKFLLWNSQFEKVSQYTASEIEELTPLDFIVPESHDYIKNSIIEGFEKGESSAETYLITKNKEKIYYYFTAKEIIYKDQICLISSGIDLSERKRAAEELRRNEEQMISIFNNSIDAVVVMDTEGIVTNWNPRAEEIFGWKNHEALGKSVAKLIILEDSKEDFNALIQAEYSIIKNSRAELRAISKDKKNLDISLGISTVILGGKEYFIAFVTDITHRKEIEKIKEFERRDKEALINSTNDLIWSVSKEFKLIAGNNAYLQSIKDYTGMDIKIGSNLLTDTINYSEEVIQYWKSLYERALKGESFTTERSGSGNEEPNKIWETTFNPIFHNGIVEAVACYSRDITQNKLHQKEIQDYNEKLKTAQEIAKLGYWEWDFSKGTLFWSHQVFLIWEVDEGTFIPTQDSFFETVHPDDRGKFRLYTDQPVDNMDEQDIEYRIHTGKNNLKWIHQVGKIFVDPSGKTYFKGTLRDITEKKQNLHELREYNNKLKTAQEIAKMGYWEYPINSDKIAWTDEVYKIWEVSPEEFQSTYSNFLNTIHPLDKPRHKIEEDLAIKDKKPLDFKHRIILPNGKVKWVHERGKLIKDKTGKPLLLEGTVQDITEQKLKEDEILSINEKLRNLSAHLQNAREEERIFIAREIHDELGQQLTSIKLDAYWLKKRVEDIFPEGKERTHRMIESINYTINKVRKIATDLRPGVLDDLGLEAAIEWHLEQFEEQTQIKNKLETKDLQDNYSKSINTVVYRIFQEALTNIMRHAEATEILVKLYEKSDNLVMEVIDNGKGITETQKNNSNTLGITGIKERIQLLDGTLDLGHQEGGGTKLMISIPLDR